MLGEAPFFFLKECYTMGMDPELKKKLEAQDERLEQIYQSVEKTRKYFLWTMIATLVAFVLPLIGLVFAVPFFLSTLSTAYGL